MTFRTRFAPSPTGPLHLGHAYSALVADRDAKAAGGECLLRIEDIDQSRSRPQWEAQIYQDLVWLGLSWPHPVMRQSNRTAAYHKALAKLDAMGLTYTCTCRRADIEAAAGAPQEGVPQFGPDGRIYPGTCRQQNHTGSGAIRLNVEKALRGLDTLTFTEVGNLHYGPHLIGKDMFLREIGDIILVRRGMAASYHLSVVVDDADQGITQVTRGADLWEATQIHVLLQALLGLPTPTYHHHDLIRDETGKRLAKRDDARAIAKYREDGATPEDVRRLVGF